MGLKLKDRQNLWSSVEQSMFHFECQRHYGSESEALAAWLNEPETVTVLRDAEPGFDAWLDMVEGHVTRNVSITRVRIVDHPMTDYQRFEWHFAKENIAAGEHIYTLKRELAETHGLLPAAGPSDWWLLDHNTVLIQPFDENGKVTGAHLLTDPADVRIYQAWKVKAIQSGFQMWFD